LNSKGSAVCVVWGIRFKKGVAGMKKVKVALLAAGLVVVGGLFYYAVLDPLEGVGEGTPQPAKEERSHGADLSEPSELRELPSGSTAKRHAIAISGCVIVSQNGRSMRYREKCEACGKVMSGSVSRAIPPPHSKSMSGFRCPKCRQRQSVVIQGGSR
jgi:hypothetical protein